MLLRRAILFSIALLLAVPIENLHAALTSARVRTLARFKSQCEQDGSGKACYDYGRALWSTPGAIDRKKALHYLFRGCELKYQLACDTYHDRSTRIRHTHRGTNRPSPSVCFSGDQLQTARFTPNAPSKSNAAGQKIDMIKANSFWDRVGFKENDIVVKVNNLPFNNQKESLHDFATAGKKFGFEVRRNGETITLWYSCD